MSEFNFVKELPASPSRSSSDPKLVRFREALHANQGEWGEYPKALSDVSVYRIASAIRTNHKMTCPAVLRGGGYEAQVVKEGDMRKLFVRYVGVAS